MPVSTEAKGSAIRLQRDRPRLYTYYPTAAIFLGLAFIAMGIGMAVHAWGATAGWSNRAAVALFGVNFALAGALLSGYAMRGRQLRQRIRSEGGRAPWRFDHNWDQRGADDDSSRRVRGNVIAIAGFILFLLPFHLVAADSDATSRVPFLLFLALFDLIIVIVIGNTCRQLWRRVALGQGRVLFRQFPYDTGQTVQLTFSGGEKFRNCQSLKAVLHCIREYYEWRGSGNTRSSISVVESIWREEAIFSTDPAGLAQLSFELPRDVPGTDLLGVPDQKPPVYWELEVTGEVSGTPYQGIFLIPVYSSGSSLAPLRSPLEMTGLTRPGNAGPNRLGNFQALFLCLFFSFFIVMGTLPMVQNTKRLVRNYHLVQSGRAATGKVIDYKQSRGSKGGSSIWPVVTYTTASGQEVTFESAYHPNYSGYSMGCQVPVLYDPAHPEIAEINEQERLWGGGVAWYLFGGVFVAIGSGGIIKVLVRRSRDKKSSSPPQLPYQT